MRGTQTLYVSSKRPYSKSAVRKHLVPGTSVAILTATSKMPGPSFSLPAGRACPNACGSVCDECYAKKGMYRFADTRNAQAVRFAWTVRSMRSDNDRALWVSAMVSAIAATGTEYFRGHDSGDFFSVEYVRSWIEVCRALPRVRFWFPTREYQSKCGLVVLNPRVYWLQQLAQLPNVTVRPSALEIRQHAPVVTGLHAGSAVDMRDVCRAYQCPAYRQGGHCGTCRVCWIEKTLPVSYPLH